MRKSQNDQFFAIINKCFTEPFMKFFAILN